MVLLFAGGLWLGEQVIRRWQGGDSVAGEMAEQVREHRESDLTGDVEAFLRDEGY
jgi:hypothetical protein